MQQLDMFDAKSAKREAMARVEEHANPDWAELMLALTLQVSRARPFFTSDDVMDAYARLEAADKPSTHELRALGPVMLRAAKLGYCRKEDCAPLPSRRRSLHASPRAVWRSLLR